MPANLFSIASRRTALAAALTVLVALVAGLALTGIPANQADAAPGRAVYLGAANAKRVPLCPDRCSSLAIVSGFQAKAGGVGNAYRVPFVGNITRWRIKLGKPSRSQRLFFERNFGIQPQAALGVLAKVSRNGKVRYKLRRRSKIQNLNRFLGKTATFNLGQPMRVNKGDFVALIVPTWAPALAEPAACALVGGKMRNPTVCEAFNLNNNWIASRDRTTCKQSPNMNNSQPQTKVNSLAAYGCRFNGALTYGARVERR